MKLYSNLNTIKGVGEKYSKYFEKLEIFSIKDLLFTFPRKYLDYTKQISISDLEFDKKHTLIAQIKNFKHIPLKGRARGRSIQKATLKDNTGEIEAIWFNQVYLKDIFKKNKKFAFIAKLSQNKRTGKVQLYAPEFEKIKSDQIHTSRIVPVYSLTRGISPKKYRRFIKNTLDELDKKELENLEKIYSKNTILKIKNELSTTNLTFISIKSALQEIHFPSDYKNLKNAQFRLGIEELIPIQKKLIKTTLLHKNANSITNSKNIHVHEQKILNDYWSNYDFEPTKDQIKICQIIYKEFMSNKPIYRLLQGDVGSGKTAVAGFLIYLTFLVKKDIILMAPTTILAKQHYENFKKIFPKSTELVISESTTKPSKNHRLFIGTQALLFRYKKLNLNIGTVIIDEEHRFGVNQRKEIAKLSFPKNLNKKLNLPNYLSITATPIPRTMALAIFGSIDISIIKTKPKNQIPKKTFIVPEKKRKHSYQWIYEQIQKGNQIFWICPLIETINEVENQEVIFLKSEKATIENKYKEIKTYFSKENLINLYFKKNSKNSKKAYKKQLKEIKIKKLHGKLQNKTKNNILNQFREKKFDILISTTVIEVGIDIPNANIIVIENANQFGLAQLHQLRGRVGRGKKQGYCLLFESEKSQRDIYNNSNANNKKNTKNDIQTKSQRLQYFSKENDGLKLAKYDLKMRGPGEVYGNIQSGIPNLKIADLNNEKQIKISQIIAKEQINE